MTLYYIIKTDDKDEFYNGGFNPTRLDYVPGKQHLIERW